jgi:hypothetical protein
MPNYTARQIGTAGAGGFVLGAGGRLITDSNPESTTKVVTKSMMNPETGSSVPRQVLETITDKAPEFSEAMANAGDTGLKGLLLAAGTAAIVKGVHSALNKTQFKVKGK